MGPPYAPITGENRDGTIHYAYYYCAHKKEASMRCVVSSRMSFPDLFVAGSLYVAAIKHSQPHSKSGVKTQHTPKVLHPWDEHANTNRLTSSPLALG